MKINKCELEKVCGLTSKIPVNDKKEFVLAGRSNVGKSSFINAVINRKNYARTSSVPGKTRTINYYNVDDKFYFVDLPGYGYAKASAKEQENWSKFINKYLSTSEMIEEIIMIVDIRHKPSDKDISMFRWIVDNTGFEPMIIATKLDKIKRSEIKKNIQIIKDTFLASDECDIIPFSAETKTGVDEFLKIIENLV